MLKRSLSVILCLCMVLSIVTVSASAENTTDIYEVDVTGITEAVVGETATTDGISVSADAHYTLESAQWYDNTDPEEPPQTMTGAFETKKLYFLELVLAPKEGYIFSDEYIDVTLNGDDFYGYSEVIEGKMIITIDFSFFEAIENVDITGVVDAVIGNSPVTDGIKIPDGVNYVIDGAEWMDAVEYTLLDSTDVFEDREKYYLSIYLKANLGYGFNDHDAVFTVNGEEVDPYYAFDNEACIRISYSFLEQIMEVKAPAAPDYAVGDKIVVPVFERGEGINYDINYTWYYVDRENGYMYIEDEDEAVFEDGKSYDLEVQFIPDDGYGFSEDVKVFIGDEEVEETENGETYMYTDVYYYFGFEEINKIELTIPEMKIGEKVDYSAFSVPEDAHYEINYVDYLEAAEDDYSKAKYFYKEFKKDNYYWLDSEFVCDEGYFFADNVEIYINGKKVNTFEKNFSFGPYYTYCVTDLGKLVEIKDSSAIFSDVKKGSWYQEYVDYVSSHNLMNGVGGDKFGTTDTVTRATVVTVLARMSGIDTNAIMNTQTPFTDAPAGKWYSGAVAWAVENGITKGASATTFEPDKAVSREDICTFIYRYAEFAGVEFNKNVEKSSFSDEATMGSWAKDAIYACQQAEIVNGKPGGIFDAKGKASRSEISKILAIFHNDYIN